MKLNKNAVRVIAFIAALAAVVTAAFFAGKSYERSRYSNEAKKISEALEIIEEKYIGEYDGEALADSAIDAIVASLGDRWSYYMTEEEYESYKERVNNSYYGIGITLAKAEDGSAVVYSVIDNSPAADAGVCSGDVVVSVNGSSCMDMTVDEIRSTIKNDPDGTVELVLRGKDGSQRNAEVTCGQIDTPPISYEMLDGGIGYIDIANFDDGCADGFIAAADVLLRQGTDKFIFDVRSNGGGYVSELIDILDYLLGEGELFISVGKDGKEKIYTSDDHCIDAEIVVLVDENTYSAAEFFAAALREYDMATIMGVNTTGKNRSQITITMKDGSAIHISSARYLTPGRVDLCEAGGIVPDVYVELSTEYDNQLEEAVDFLS